MFLLVSLGTWKIISAALEEVLEKQYFMRSSRISKGVYEFVGTYLIIQEDKDILCVSRKLRKYL
jgi:hypothetical protein